MSGSSCPSTQDILYLLDKYGVSDKFYHEILMLTPSLSRSYKVKRLRKELSSVFETKPLHPPFDGSYRDIEEHMTKALSALINSGREVKSPVEVKIAGDGAPFHRSASYVLLSFSFPSLDPASESAAGTHTFAVLKW
jgi:hypothetical protein